jgi:hypothetical protein
VEKNKFYKKKKGEYTLARSEIHTAHPPNPTMRDLSSSPSTSPSSSPNGSHNFLMAKERKVFSINTPKYTFSSDEESSDDEDDYSMMFKGLDRTKIDKINELINTLNEKE